MIPKTVNLPLKMVTNRIKSCRAVTWALDTFSGRLLPKLGELFDPLLEEGQVTPFETQLALFHKKLVAGCEAVVATDRAYRDQRARETRFRALRNEALAEVNSKVVVLRQAFGGIYSEEKLAEMGFARRTPQQSGELLEQATHLAARLSEPTFDLSGARVDGFQGDLPQAVGDLGPAAEKLGTSIDNLTREERRTEAAMLAKDDAFNEYNRTFLHVARTVESLFRLAGYDEVARRVRPSSRRPGETVEPFEEPGGGADQGDASPEPASPSAPPPS
jgi:hypothetical protein